MVMLTAPQINAMEMEIREPSQMASKVDSPAPPVPGTLYAKRPGLASIHATSSSSVLGGVGTVSEL